MMDFNSVFANDLRSRASAPGALPPATIGEIWSSEWKSAGLDTLTGSGEPYATAWNEFASAFESTVGRGIPAYARDQGEDITGGRSQRLAAVRRMVAGLPEDQRAKLEPLADVDGIARKRAGKTEREAEDIRARTYGLSGVATAFAAQAARQIVDPFNLATAPLGGPGKGPVLRMLGREFLIGAAAQGVQEPIIESNREALGLEAGFARGLRNTIESGIGAAGLAGLFRGGSYLARRAGDYVRDPTGTLAGNRTAGEASALSIEDLDALARLSERDALSAEASRAAGYEPHLTEAAFGRFYGDMERGTPFDAEGWLAARREFEGREAVASSSEVRDAPAQQYADLETAMRARETESPDFGDFSPASRAAPDDPAAPVEMRARDAADRWRRQQNPELFARIDTLESDIARARADLADVIAQRDRGPPALETGRLAEIENELRNMGRKLRNGARGKELARERDRLMAEASNAPARNAAFDADAHAREQGSRLRLIELQQERARLGPQVSRIEGFDPGPRLGGMLDSAHALPNLDDGLRARILSAYDAAEMHAAGGKAPGRDNPATRLFYLDDDLTEPASRKVIADRIEHAAWLARNDAEGIAPLGLTPEAILRAAAMQGVDLPSYPLAKNSARGGPEKPNGGGSRSPGSGEGATGDPPAGGPRSESAGPAGGAGAAAAPPASPLARGLPDAAEQKALRNRLDALAREVGEDFELHEADGTKISLRTALARLDADRNAATEMLACAGGSL